MATDTPPAYRRLDAWDREVLFRGLADGKTYRQIARELGRPPSTVSREAARNGGRQGYCCADCAGRKTRARAAGRHAVRTLDRNARLRRYVLAKLVQARWSPEQIAHALPAAYPGDTRMRISHESIYAWIYVRPKGALKDTLRHSLRQKRQYRRRRGRRKSQEASGQIPRRVSIDERPHEVLGREIPGHWEGDLVRGRRNQSAIGTLTERTTRYAFLVPLASAEAEAVRRAFAATFRKLPRALAKSLTYDQGKEMSEHEAFTRVTKVAVYFAHPRSPWERGTNENYNGLVRDFFPKGTDFRTVPAAELRKVQKLLNTRPRKVLDWRTPEEVLSELLR